MNIHPAQAGLICAQRERERERDRQTDMMKPIITFHKFANKPKNYLHDFLITTYFLIYTWLSHNNVIHPAIVTETTCLSPLSTVLIHVDQFVLKCCTTLCERL
jgi:hypothetical protein